MSAITIHQNGATMPDGRVFLLGLLITLFMIGVWNVGNYREMVRIETSLDDFTPEQLEQLERNLEKTLELAKDGLPLTENEMQRLQKLYNELLAHGGKAGGVIERILLLCKQIVIASGATEVYLEHLQNSQKDTDDELQGMGRN